MDKPSSSRPPQKSSAGRRVRLIPATPKPEGTAVPTPRHTEIPNIGTSQPPETFGGNLYAKIIKEAMDRINRNKGEEGKTNSSESSSEAATTSGAQTSPTSSSSLRFSTDDNGEAEESQGRKKTGRTFEEIASEVIKEMHETEAEEDKKVMKRSSGLIKRPGREEISRTIEEIESEAIRVLQDIERERKGKGKSVQTRKVGEPRKASPTMILGKSHENPIREIYDLTETDDEETAAPDDWRKRMEERVEALVIENAEQNALLEIQGGQITKLVDLVDKVVSHMKGETQASHQPRPASSIASQNKPPLDAQGPDLAGPSRKRKSTTATNQPLSTLHSSSAAKRTRQTRHSGSQGSQRGN